MHSSRVTAATHVLQNGMEAMPPITGYKKQLLEDAVTKLSKA